MSHLDSCRDVTSRFGVNIILSPVMTDGAVFSGKIVVKKLSNYKDADVFDYDPYWDDESDVGSPFAVDTSSLLDFHDGDDDDMRDDTNGNNDNVNPPINLSVPSSSKQIIETTMTWVDTFMSKMGICPFSTNALRAGLPVGNVHYALAYTSIAEEMYRDYWGEVVRLEGEGEDSIATTLLIAPNYEISNVEAFESFSNTLTNSLTVLKMEDVSN